MERIREHSTVYDKERNENLPISYEWDKCETLKECIKAVGEEMVIKFVQRNMRIKEANKARLFYLHR